jgi:two-component system CheB/CheR fusion protein
MNPFPIVAVASSTGDLEAVVELLSALPAACGQAFIIVQQLYPGRHGTLLHDTLAERTAHPVVFAHDGVMPERGHVYVMRAGVALMIMGGCISASSGASALQGPGDTLFTSLAADRGHRAIGVVLSGGGSDGALGIQAIKKAGGTTFAQYPGSARFPSMPISAIETGCVGSVLRPNEIAHELIRLSRLNLRTAATASEPVPLCHLEPAGSDGRVHPLSSVGGATGALALDVARSGTRR